MQQLFNIFLFLLIIKISEFSTIPKPKVNRRTGMKTASTINFSYDDSILTGPRYWPSLFTKCGRPNQSPIHIVTLEVLDGRKYSIRWNNFGVIDGKLINNGHAPEILVPRNKVLLQGVPGMPGDIRFTLSNIHFHFGKVLKPGAEHSVGNKVYAGEIHLDHYNMEFPSYAEAASGSDPEALVSVAILFEVDWSLGYHSELDLFILKYMSQIISPNAGGIQAPIKLSDLLPTSGAFYTYVGSQTVPPCSTNVRWIVAEKTIKISPASLFTLYLLKDSKGVPISKFGNSRPAQDIGRRIVEANFRRTPRSTGLFIQG